MKRLLLFGLFLVASYMCYSQNGPYIPFEKTNEGVVRPLSQEYEKGDTTYYLNYSDGASITTYVLTDWQGSLNNIPTTFSQGWSLNFTISPSRKTIPLQYGQLIISVLDANYNSYSLIGTSF